jgi:hypothetical protein
VSRKAQALSPVPRLALTIAEAAAALGMSETAFREHVVDHLPIRYIDGMRRVLVADLERYMRELPTTIGIDVVS